MIISDAIGWFVVVPLALALLVHTMWRFATVISPDRRMFVMWNLVVIIVGFVVLMGLISLATFRVLSP